ncbi:hypothetical protein ASD40_02030 [Paenibacillus sp. Root444D2]|nr:hypothetical protein ASD40_02030 [Paenibacillus sp. Root444D2]
MCVLHTRFRKPAFYFLKKGCWTCLTTKLRKRTGKPISGTGRENGAKKTLKKKGQTRNDIGRVDYNGSWPFYETKTREGDITK